MMTFVYKKAKIILSGKNRCNSSIFALRCQLRGDSLHDRNRVFHMNAIRQACYSAHPGLSVIAQALSLRRAALRSHPCHFPH